jgi:CUB/sushi domain-containing protein
VEFFTFGIRGGNPPELWDMSSEPKEKHMYILDSFAEFEALARRALHEGTYMLNRRIMEFVLLCG